MSIFLYLVVIFVGVSLCVMDGIFGYLFGVLDFWTYCFSRERVYIFRPFLE